MHSAIGSIQSWLTMVTAALSPLIALLVGFVGTDRWLRWQLGDKHDRTPPKVMKFGVRVSPPASLGSFTQRHQLPHSLLAEAPPAGRTGTERGRGYDQ